MPHISETLEIEIRSLLQHEQAQQVVDVMEEYVKSGQGISDSLLYLWGNAYRKLGDIPSAMSLYAQSIRLNSNSPAKQALKAAERIMSFYNENMFNQ